MSNIHKKNKIKKHGSLSKKEIDALFKNDEEKTSQEEKSLEDYFNEIVKLDDLAIQKVYREIHSQELAKALKSTNEKIQNKIFQNMSKRASKMLKEDMEYMGPIRLKDVEESQSRFLSILYHLINTGEITVPKDFLIKNNLNLVFSSLHNLDSGFKDIEEFAVYLTKRQQVEELYGLNQNVTVCRFFEIKNNENILADIEQTNKEQNMGNFQIPNTKIKLINFSICPKCARIFSFKELIDYYANPNPDSTFKDRAKQYREDTRVFCHECKTYFLPALVVSDGTPKNEVQFLCRVQTTNAIEEFYRNKYNEKPVLTAKKENILNRKSEGKILKAIRNDVSLKELSPKPTLISNLLQYTPANLALNLIDGSNFEKGDVLFGAWQ
ncbi:hypothetical protein R84B8_02201 [Treponema sp. R8-4-B8]